MFNDHGELLLDDDIAAEVNEIQGEFDDREALTNSWKKSLQAIKDLFIPKAGKIADRLIPWVHAVNIDKTNLPELPFEPTNSLKDELITYWTAKIEQCHEQAWRNDLHLLLDHTLDTMIKGGLIKSVIEREHLGEEQYKEFHDNLMEYEDKAVKGRDDYYQDLYNNMVKLMADDDLIIKSLIEDPMVIALVLAIEKRDNESGVEVTIARRDQTVDVEE
ncbi:MAG: hypothetical protein HDQ88_07355 [Clostridia bacterium]|nr:hypothetical protein [Clostridia bacterium]